MSTLLALVRALNETYDGSYTTTSSDAPDIPPSSDPFPVEPGGFLVGGMLACLLYGIHISQIYTYFSRVRWRSVPSTSFGANFRSRGGGGSNSTPLPPAAAAPLAHRLIVLWVFTLSTCHVLIVIPSAYWYFVGGLREPERWGRFYWLLSVQDGVVPLMAATAQLYFGHRAWCLTGRKPWFRWALIAMVVLTMSMGVCLAVAAHEYSDSPWLSTETLNSLPIALISESFSITWMALSAFIDGSLTFILVYKFARARQSTLWSTRRVARRLMALTLETVLLTHIVGATMCVLFLASDKRHRTRNNLFWVLLEIMAELYALSVLFTVMSHERTRRGLRGDQEWGWESTITDDAEHEGERDGDGGERGEGGRARRESTGAMHREGEGDSGRNGQGGQVKHARRRGGRVRDAVRVGASDNSSEKDGSNRSNGKKSEPRDLSQSELDRRVEGYQTRNRYSISTLPYHQPKQRQQVNVVPAVRPSSGLDANVRSNGHSKSESSNSSTSDSTPGGSGSVMLKGHSRESTPIQRKDGYDRGGSYAWHGGSTTSDLSDSSKGDKEKDKESIALDTYDRRPMFDRNSSALGLALGPDVSAANTPSGRQSYGMQEYAYMPTLYSQAGPPPRLARSRHSDLPGENSRGYGSAASGLQLFADTPASEYSTPGLEMSDSVASFASSAGTGLGLEMGSSGSGLGLALGPSARSLSAASTLLPHMHIQPWQRHTPTPVHLDVPTHASAPPQSIHAPPPVSPRRKGQHLSLAEEDDPVDVNLGYADTLLSSGDNSNDGQSNALGLGTGLSITTPGGPPVPVTPAAEDNTLTPLYTYTPLGTAIPIPMIAVQGRTVSFGQAVERGILTDGELEVGVEGEVGGGASREGTPRATSRGASAPRGMGLMLDGERTPGGVMRALPAVETDEEGGAAREQSASGTALGVPG